MKSYIFKHVAAIFLALIVGFLMVAPQLVFIKTLGDAYQGIYMMASDAEVHYLAKMREATEGNFFGNPYLFEFQEDLPTAIFTLSEGILALPSVILDIPISTLNLIYKFILPAIVTLLAYALIYRLTNRRLWSLAGAALFMLGSNLLNLPDLMALFKWEQNHTQFAMFARPIHPQFSAIILLLFWYQVVSVIRNPHYRNIVALTAIVAAAFYIYFYSWTYMLAFLAVWIGWLAWCRRWQLASRLVVAGLVSTVMGLPVLHNLWKLSTHAYYSDLAALGDVLSSHAPVFSTAAIIVTVLFLLTLRFIKGEEDAKTFFGLGVVTSFVVVNQQVISGVALQEGHYHWYFNSLLFVVFLIWGLECIIARSSSRFYYERAAAIVIILVALANVYLVQASSYRARVEEATNLQGYAPVLKWLNTNTEMESVIVAGDQLSGLVPIYTHNNVAWQSYAAYYLMPQERREHTVQKIVDAKFKNLEEYKADYIVWDTKRDPQWQVEENLKVQPIYQHEHIKVYSL